MLNRKTILLNNFKGINDTTLREGEQYNGSSFSFTQQKKILSWLYAIGVDTVEVGNPIVPQLARDIKRLSQTPHYPALMAHIRNKESDLSAALAVGVQGVHMLCTADPDRLEKMNLTLEDHIKVMRANVRRAKDHGLVVRVSVEHGLEVRFFSDALEILKEADRLGVDRVQVADTRGVLFPWDVYDIVSKLREVIKTDIGVHLHNDFGQAMGNAIQALAAGANWIDTTLLGVGERTGITSLSTFLASLYYLDPKLKDRYAFDFLTAADKYMADILSMEIPHNLITSKTAFSHKAGIHVNALLKQGVGIYEPLDPKVVGNQRVIVTESRISGKTKTKDIKNLLHL